MKIICAENMGFCSGVENAVKIAGEAANRAHKEGLPVYCTGPVIHNKDVCADLDRLGLITVESIEDVPEGSTYIVRSHGETLDILETARKRNLRLIDTTCSKVRRVQLLAADAAEKKYMVAIVGDPTHPEVKSVLSYAGKDAVVMNSIDEVEKIVTHAAEEEKKLLVLFQTTYDIDTAVEISENFKDSAGDSIEIIIENTICSATEKRQKDVPLLASETDAIIIIGDKSSSNSRKLYEIAKKVSKNVHFIENSSELPLKKMADCYKIGITAGASTPQRVIKEVITSMSELGSSNENNPMHEYMDEIEKALRLPRNGDVITGEIIQVTDKYVIVNIGCKKDGIIPRNEVNLEPEQGLQDVFNEGEEVQAKVLKNDDGDGNILLSKKRVIVSEHWEDISRALEEKETLEVKVVKEVNGGVIAAFNEINGFIPMSQLSDRYIEKADEFVGQTMQVKVMRVDQKRNKVVFSHKAVLNEERQKRMMEIWDTISVGEVIDGKVMRFTEYGAFVDIGGIDGLLHISEISWGKLRHPEEVLEIDQEIKVKVLSMNKEKEKISLGYKQNLPEPWSVINEKYDVGQVISGKAVQLKDYGVFVELEPGLDGLVHISEIAYKRVGNINEEIEVGQDISAKILEIDKDRRRISLSIKETLEKPEPEELEETNIDEEAKSAGAVSSEGADEVPSVGDKVKEALDEAEPTEEVPAEDKAEEEPAAEDVPAEDKAEEETAAEEAPVEEEAAVEEAPVEEKTEEAPAEEEAPADEEAKEAPTAEEAEEAPAEEIPEEAPADEEAPAEDKAEEVPVEEKAEEAPAEEEPAAEEAPVEDKADEEPAEEAPAEDKAEEAPAEEAPADEEAEEAPAAEEIPEETPAEEEPAEEAPAEEESDSKGKTKKKK